MSKNNILLILIASLHLFSCVAPEDEIGVENGSSVYLDCPSGLQIEEYTDNSVKLSWNKVDNAEEYRYKLVAVFDEKLQKADSTIAIGITSGLYKTIWDLDKDCYMHNYRYWFSVSSVNGSSYSDYCEPLRVEPGGFAPSVPGNVECSSYTDRGLTYVWSPSDDASSYDYQLLSKNGDIVVKGNTADCRFTFDGLKKGRYYYFQVRGVNDLKSSLYSEMVEGLTFGEFCPALTFSASTEDYLSIPDGLFASVDDGLCVSTYQTKTVENSTVLELVSDDEPEAGRSYFATLPSEIDGVVLPYEYTYNDNVFSSLPMWAQSESTELEFKTYMGMLVLNVKPNNESVLKRLSVRSDTDIAGEVVTYVNGTTHSVTVAGSKTIDMTFPNGLIVQPEGQEVYIPLPSGTYTRLFITLTFDYNFPIQVQVKNIDLTSGQKTKVDLEVTTQTTAPEEFTVPLSFVDGWPFTNEINTNQNNTGAGDLYTLSWNGMLVPYKIQRGTKYKYQDAEGRLQLKKDDIDNNQFKWIMIPGMGGRYISSVSIENTQSSTRKFTFKSSLAGGSLKSLSVKKGEMSSSDLVNADGDRLLNDGENLYILLDYNQLYYITRIDATYSTIK